MVANFYIIPASFENNSSLSKDEIEERIKMLANDVLLIKEHKDTNKIYVHSDIYNVCFINGITICELVYDLSISRKYFNRDVSLALRKIIINSAKATDITSEKIIQCLLPNHNSDNCYGLIAFNKIENIENAYQIVYPIGNWYIFRRYFLGLYPKNGEYFIEESKIYFPELFFHERNKKTVEDIFGNCSRKIVFHLAALNDKYKDFLESNLNRTQRLKNFSIVAGLDEIASPEGDASRKNKFTFDFINDSGLSENICCESHLKLCHNDNYPGDSSHSTDRRIYFNEGKNNIQQRKILIGHIGKHL